MLLELSDFVETMMRDDRIKGVLSTRTHGLLGLPLEFSGKNDDAIAALAGEPGEGNGEWSAMHDESEVAKLLAWGLFGGVGLAQRIELPRVLGQPHRYRLQTWSPRWLTYYNQPVNGSHWRVITEQGQHPVVAGDGEWILFLPYGARRPWAEGAWVATALPWLLKHFSLEDRANFSETLGSPIWVGTTAKGGTEKQRNRFKSQLRNMGKNGKLVLPEGWDLKLVEASGTGKSGDVFSEQIKDANEAITIALAGQLVTTEGTPGFSSGNIHDAIKQDLIRFDAQRLSSCLREQSLEPWAMQNYGSYSAAPWPLWQTKKPEDASEKADGIAKVGDAIAKLDAALKAHGLQADAKKIMAEMGIPVLTGVVDPAV